MLDVLLYSACAFVSLFTRERIEMILALSLCPATLVSLFTRERIEISLSIASTANFLPSPSLRGSGLKLERYS